MPWSNQTGNGGWQGGGGGGPWGQGPQNPRGPGGGGSPDLEEILRRGQDRLRRAMPGGSGSTGGFALGALIIAGLVVLWLFKSVYTVQPDEVGVELLFGDPKQELSGPGLHVAFWPFETVNTVPVTENQITLGDGQPGDASGLMLSGDQNIVDVQFSVLYEIADPQNFLFSLNDPQSMVRQVAESAMREVVGRRPVQDIFRDDRAGIARAVKDIVQQTLNEYGAGIRINDIAIEDAAPPAEVADAFEEVQRAEQNEDQFVEEANRYQNQQLGQARGQAAQIREAAAAYKDRVVQQAEGEAARFTAILAEYEKAPQITRKRLYLERMESVLSDSNMVIVDEDAGGAQGIVPYLPLTEVQRRAQQDGAGTADASGNATSNASGATQGGN